MVREMINRNNKAHVKAQAKKQAQQPTKTYSVEVRVQIMEKPNTKEGKSIIYWKTKFITLDAKCPLVDGQLDQRDSNNVYDEIKDLFDLYNVEILNWQVKKLKEINNKKGFEKIQNKQKSIA